MYVIVQSFLHGVSTVGLMVVCVCVVSWFTMNSSVLRLAVCQAEALLSKLKLSPGRQIQQVRVIH